MRKRNNGIKRRHLKDLLKHSEQVFLHCDLSPLAIQRWLTQVQPTASWKGHLHHFPELLILNTWTCRKMGLATMYSTVQELHTALWMLSGSLPAAASLLKGMKNQSVRAYQRVADLGSAAAEGLTPGSKEPQRSFAVLKHE